ncbi:unnamed protein product [Ambrosiozyma monospora]|uniref:Unnamed protein product n=1 Tax=Ambrosiozyma monospora TaxID=43982 RepID=A0A9W6YWV7_AMBMO|nr:unnamed protein product [Ambrosiozyma monospora]
MCHAKYSLLDVSSMWSADVSNFVCNICGGELVEDDSGLEAQKGQEKLENLMNQIKPTIDSLKQIDDLKIADNNFESSLIKHIPASSSSLASYSVFNKAGNKLTRKEKEQLARERANGNYFKKSQASINVEITNNEADLKRREQDLQNAKNEKLRQNALPAWYLDSTVGQAALGKLDGADEPEEGEESANANADASKEGTPSATSVKPEVKSETHHSFNNHNKDAKSNLTAGSTKSSTFSTANGGGSTSSSSKATSAGGGSSAEMDALTAYYDQLRARQAEEEAEEMEEDADEDAEGLDDDDLEAFGEDEDEDMIDESAFADEVDGDTANANGAGDKNKANPATANAASNVSNVDIEDEDDIDEADFEDVASDAD